MRGWPRYAQYKASGVEWLGDVPEHWEVVGLHYLARLRSGNSITALDFQKEGDYPVYGGNGFRGYIDYYTHEGDYVLIGRQGALCGNINFASGKFFASEHAIVVNPTDEFNSKWLGLLLLTMNLNQYSVSAAQPGLSAETIGRLRLPVPTFKEQTAIAQFLDQKTAQIDALIAKKQQLLEKLAEQRTALISHAVTKGLDPNAPMKDSGVAWLGEVPEHWEVKRLKFISESVQTGTTPPSANPEYYDSDDVDWFSPSDFSNRNLYLEKSKKRLSQLALEDGSVKNIAPNSILIVGIGATLGKVGMNRSAATANQQINAVLLHQSICSSFILYSLSVKQELMKLISNSTTLGIMNQDKTKQIPLSIPPITEQTAIAQYLDQKTAELDQMTDKVQAVIDKLKEYRAALITQAVTGQIDVRGLIDV
jgi:type I restriction enzyme S subunit